jgi:hypothetical protein
MTATLTPPPAVPPPANPPLAPPRPTMPSPPRASGNGDVRRTLLALLASALGALPLCELFVDRGWLIDVWLTMVVVVAPGALLRLRRPASAVQVWIGVLLLIPWLTVNFVRQHAVFGLLPLRGAWHDVGRLMTDLHQTTTSQVAPVHTDIAIRLALCALLGLTTALIDLIAVVGRRGVLAGVPLLIIFTISGAVPRHPVSWIWFCFAAVGFLILLALDSSDDLQRWGHYIPRTQRTARVRSAALSGQRIAILAVVLALLVPLFVPSNSRNFVANLFHPHNHLDAAQVGFGANQNSGGTGGITPFAALHGQLARGTKVDLFHVQISSASKVGTRTGIQPFYLRTNVLSDFDGRGWRADPEGPTEPADATSFESSPGTPVDPDVVHFDAAITVTGLRSNPPIFGSPVDLSGVGGDTDWSARDMLLVDSTVNRGQQIQEVVAQPHPSVAALQAARGDDPGMNRWLALPTIAPYVKNLTSKLTANAKSPYAAALAISNYFSNSANGFTYSLQTANGDSADDLTNFLQTKVGYCQQYAAAMAVMLRLAGVPSRVVLGYAHNVPDANGAFTVTTYDAHAWDEAYFTGIGWIPFDPTPLDGISGGAFNDLSWAKHDGSGGGQGGLDIGAAKKAQGPADTHKTPTKAAAAPTTQSGSPVAPIGISAIVLALLAVLMAPAAVRWRRRRHRLHQARHGDTEALWTELSDTATDLGYVWSTARTPRQVVSWLGGTAQRASPSLRTLTGAVERARYAPTGARGTQEADLERSLAAVQAELRSRRTTAQRLRARFWPASLRWSRVRWVGRWLPGPSD